MIYIYKTDDLYKCFIKSLIKSKSIGGISGVFEIDIFWLKH